MLYIYYCLTCVFVCIDSILVLEYIYVTIFLMIILITLQRYTFLVNKQKKKKDMLMPFLNIIIFFALPINI